MKMQNQIQERITIDSGGWKLIGDILLPDTITPVPVVILLNKAAGNRTVYGELSAHLLKNGIGSLQIDLRGHGESINRGRFTPEEGTLILK